MLFTVNSMFILFKSLKSILGSRMFAAYIVLILTSINTSHSIANDQFHTFHNQQSLHSHFKNLLIANNGLISADRAIQIAKQGRNSKALKVSRQTFGQREVYRVKLITNKGLVRVVLVDAVTGELIKGK